MAKTQPIPDELQVFMNMPEHYILKMNTFDRCKQAHCRIVLDGWPVERTCAAFEISSTWYRNRSLRFGAEWIAEWEEKSKIIDAEYVKWDAWEAKVFEALGYKAVGDCTDDSAYDVFGKRFYHSELFKTKSIKIFDDDGDIDDIDMSHITPADLATFRDQFWIDWNQQRNNHR